MTSKNKELVFSVSIDACEIQTFCTGGPGGQHQNRSQTGIRIIHKQSGAVGESRESKSQHANKKLAFRRMGESDKFRKWAILEVSRRAGNPSPKEQVKKEMKPELLKIESQIDGKWQNNILLLPTPEEIDKLIQEEKWL